MFPLCLKGKHLQDTFFYLLEIYFKILISSILPNFPPRRTHFYPVPYSGVQRSLYIQHHR